MAQTLREGGMVDLLGDHAGLSADLEEGGDGVDCADTVNPLNSVIDSDKAARIFNGDNSALWSADAVDFAPKLQGKLSEESEDIGVDVWAFHCNDDLKLKGNRSTVLISLFLGMEEQRGEGLLP